MHSIIGIGLVRGPHKINWWAILFDPWHEPYLFRTCNCMVWCLNTGNFVKFACDFLRHLNDSSSSCTIHVPFSFEATQSQILYNILLVIQQFVFITPTVHQTEILASLFNLVTKTPSVKKLCPQK
jgi:hypothetical protein